MCSSDAIITSQLLSRTAREASTRVSTRDARVRAPHLPVSQCEVIRAAVLGRLGAVWVVEFEPKGGSE